VLVSLGHALELADALKIKHIGLLKNLLLDTELENSLLAMKLECSQYGRPGRLLIYVQRGPGSIWQIVSVV
jgi:hypothetical protein